MTIYEMCDSETRVLAGKILEEHHRALYEAGVTVAFVFAHAPKDEETGEPLGAAIRVHGYVAAGVARIVNLKDRIKGVADAEIVLDGDRWGDWSKREQSALIDHELQHLELKMTRGAHPTPLHDAADRPLLRLRKHDHELGWFDAIAERWGSDSFEIQQAKRLATERGQLYFGFIAPPLESPPIEEVLREARSPAPRTRRALESQKGLDA